MGLASPLTMARSEPLVTARSMLETRCVRGRNAAACCRSSISSARSRVRMVYAMAMPTLPLPMTETLVNLWRCAVGVAPPSATGRKKPEDASPASKPSSESDETFLIFPVADVDELVLAATCLVLGI